MNDKRTDQTSPAARDLIARDRRHVWHPFTQHGTEAEPTVIARAKGASLFDAQGREILDLISSWWTCTHGHAHPKINAALARQAERLDHVMFAGFTHEPAVSLAERLAALLPADLNRVFFSDDGSTAVEVAIKIAYQSWINRGEPRRRMLLAFDGGYHGDTLGAMSVGRGSQMFGAFRDLMCKVCVLPYPATFDGDDAADEREAGALSAFDALLTERGQTIAALIIEPLMQGAGGMRFCRPRFLKRLVETAQKAGIIVIFDEVATGFGRTGTLFALEQAGVVPDLICLSKGLTAGYMPLSATVARDAIFDMFLGDSFERALPHGHSFTANPLSCAVALASLDLFDEERTFDRIAHIHARHRDMLGVLAARTDVTKPRVLGSVLAFEVKEGGQYQSEQSRALRDWYLAHGLNIRPMGATVYLMPPYCITDEELARAYAGMIDGLDALASGA
ncbi:MAG: adenosylmethionine--8-amino-7-oxononanoate transaminase [Methyloceanibacter sp.]|uniref:adenosylmethionine--8-amino-7-oxononanoate transaminase n=1 Tax=Methyloceanibacter sp. TaxID=1965321 RepID=UPI003D6C7C06